MTTNKEECGNCKFYREEHGTDKRVCMRFPNAEWTNHYKWCGEWAEKAGEKPKNGWGEEWSRSEWEFTKAEFEQYRHALAVIAGLEKSKIIGWSTMKPKVIAWEALKCEPGELQSVDCLKERE